MSNFDQTIFSLGQLVSQILDFVLPLPYFELEFLNLMFHGHVMELNLLHLLPHPLEISIIVGISTTSTSLDTKLFMLLC